MRFLMMTFAVLAFAHASFADYVPLNLKTFPKQRGEVELIRLEIDEKAGDKNMGWQLTQLQADLFTSKLLNLGKTHQPDANGLKPEAPSKNYQGVVVHMKNNYDEDYAPIRVFNGVVYSNNYRIGYDTNRALEYWLFSTAKIVKHQMKALAVVPVYSYAQCVALGNQVIDSIPRQCMTVNDEIFLEVPEVPTQEELKIKDFDACLKSGRALIDVFPRRCVASGGRIFTEPPQLPDLDKLTPDFEAVTNPSPTQK